nr:MAG TPA: hypothetical protein [Caudoviricetes sp.]
MQKKEKQMRVSSIQIDENVIIYENSFINIDNISLITISPIPSNISWIGAILLGLLGYGISTIKDLVAVGIIILLIAIIWFLAVIIHNCSRGNNLAINLNSGTTLYFNCQNINFLNQVVNVMLQSMKNKTQCIISFDKCTISGGVLNEATILNK